jgi:hypothetical protein
VGQLHRLRKPRVLFGDARGRGLGITWHEEQGLFVLSLWEGERCTGTIQLAPSQAARLVAILGEQLAQSLAADDADERDQVPEAIGI